MALIGALDGLMIVYLLVGVFGAASRGSAWEAALYALSAAALAALTGGLIL